MLSLTPHSYFPLNPSSAQKLPILILSSYINQEQLPHGGLNLRLQGKGELCSDGVSIM